MVEMMCVWFFLLSGFGGAFSSDVQSQDAAPSIGHAASWGSIVCPPPDPAAPTAASAAAAADSRRCSTGTIIYVHSSKNLDVVTMIRFARVVMTTLLI